MMLFVALGGMIGAVLRYSLVSLPVLDGHQPFVRIFVVNVLGSAIFGFILAVLETKYPHDAQARAFWLSGILGSFTTFSTFSYHNVSLLMSQRFALASINMMAQVVISMLLFYGFFRLGLGIFAER